MGKNTDAGAAGEAVTETETNNSSTAIPETDDFGLPIRGYRAPPTQSDSTEVKDEALTNGDRATGDAAAGADSAHDDAQSKLCQHNHAAGDVKAEQPTQTPPVEIPAGKHAEKRIQKSPAAPATDSAQPEQRSASKAVESTQDPEADASRPFEIPTSTASLHSRHSSTAQASRKNTHQRDVSTTSITRGRGHSRIESVGSVGTGKKDHKRTDSVLSNGSTKGHRRDGSTGSLGKDVGVSEFSHQKLATKPEEETVEEDEWQEMPAYAPYDIYDDDNRLVARERVVEEDEETYAYGGLGGAGKGYTRVEMDEDALSATSMDDNTKYLFKEVKGTSMTEGGDDEARDAVSQMQATKDLLTEGQRIAYAGVVRLEVALLIAEMESLTPGRRTKKQLATAAEAMKMWGQKIMFRVYAHMDINEAEQIMIEQLAEHGVKSEDLVPALHANARVNNPMAEADSESNTPDKDKTESASQASKDGMGADRQAGSQSPSPPAYVQEEKPNIFEEKVAEAPPPYEFNKDDDVPEVHDPSQLPDSEKIDIDLRWTVLCDLFLVLVADSVYDARSRILLERVGNRLDISWLDICKFEKRVTDALEMQQQAEKENWNEEEHMEHRRKQALKRRYVMMGLATVGGGLVIGLSAGLLAPVIAGGLAAGFTTIGVTGTSAFLGGAGGAAIITSGAAASGSFIGGKAAHRRTGAVTTFEYRPLHNNKRVNLIVTVSGWLTGKVDDVRLPFSTVDPIMGDIYSVLWEPEMLRSTGATINILATEALTQGLQQVLASTVLTTLMAAIQIPIILTKLAYLIDNPWTVSCVRAVAAGKILADSIIERNLGTRPITLVGYSLGARVVFSCLQELAKKGAFGLVQNVYLFGSPIVVDRDEYVRARMVVSGRFVNAYNRNDWILGYLFRLTSGGIRRVAGLAAIEDCDFIENLDVSDLVKGHMEYRKAIPSLLIRCGWAVQSEEFSEIEDPDPDNHDQRQRELINEIEEARKQLEREGNASKGGRLSIFGRKKKLERKEWEVYEESAGKDAGGEDKGGADKSDNQGVLFDIDAIRAEIAKDQPYDAEEIQIKEIKSTLPPMKLDYSPQPTPSPRASTPGSTAQRGGLRESLSTNDIPYRGSSDTRTSADRRSTGNSHRGSSPMYGEDWEPYEEEVEMTFDTSFNEARERPPSPPAKDEPTRPGMRTSQTAPNISMSNAWADPDDDDFGKEKEVTMTFA